MMLPQKQLSPVRCKRRNHAALPLRQQGQKIPAGNDSSACAQSCRKPSIAVMLMAVLCLLPLLTGCSTSSGEKQIFPICMSMDRLEDGRLQLAVQVSSMDGGETVFAAAGDSFEQTLEILGASMPYPLHFGQLRLCILGYTLAGDSDLTELLMPLYRLYTINPEATVMVSLGNAAQTMAAQKPDLGVRLSTYLDQLLARLRQEKLTPPETLRDILHMLTAGNRDPLLGLCAVNQSAAPQKDSSSSSGSGSPQQSGQDSTKAAFSQSGRIAIGEPAPGADVPSDMTAGSLPRTGGNPVEYIGCVPVGNGRAAGLLAAQDTRLILKLRQIARVTDATETSATVLLPKQGELTPRQVAPLVTIFQQIHCDVLGVTEAVWRNTKNIQQNSEKIQRISIVDYSLTITYK